MKCFSVFNDYQIYSIFGNWWANIHHICCKYPVIQYLIIGRNYFHPVFRILIISNFNRKITLAGIWKNERIEMRGRTTLFIVANWWFKMNTPFSGTNSEKWKWADIQKTTCIKTNSEFNNFRKLSNETILVTICNYDIYTNWISSI